MKKMLKKMKRNARIARMKKIVKSKKITPKKIIGQKKVLSKGETEKKALYFNAKLTRMAEEAARPVPKGVDNYLKRYKNRKRDKNGHYVEETPFIARRRHGEDISKTKEGRDRNKTLKQVFLDTFFLLGGCEELANWAAFSNGNQTEFYRMIAKLLPREVHVEGSGSIEPNNLSNMGDEEIDGIISEFATRG